MAFTLLDIGWTPSQPNCWRDPDGNDWEFDEEHLELRPFQDALRASIDARAWRQAAGHRVAGGGGAGRAGVG